MPRTSSAAALAVMLALGASVTLSQTTRPDFDASRLQQGTFRYRTLVGGKAAGQSEIDVRRAASSGHYRYTNVITGAFSQRWEAVATEFFEPVSATLVFGEGSNTRPMFELAYKGGRVTGFALMRGQDPPARRAVDDPVSPDTIDQRIDWAAVMAVDDLAPGRTLTFAVYDPETRVSRVTVRTEGIETTKVPAGSFETVRVVYRIDKSRGPETYIARVRKAIPRFLVHETFPNGSATELVESRPQS